MAERRLRFRKNEPPPEEKKAEELVAPSEPSPILTTVDGRPRQVDPSPRSVPASYNEYMLDEWYVPAPSYDFVDVFSRRGSVIVSGLAMREAQNIVSEHNAAIARLVVAALPPATDPAEGVPTRPGTLGGMSIDVRRDVRTLDFLTGENREVVVGPSHITINLEGRGDLAAILRQALDRVETNSDDMSFSITG